MLAFALNVAIVLLISHTSALTLSLGGIIKDILLVFLSVIFFGSPVSWLQFVGYGFSLTGMNLYKEFKQNPHEVMQRATTLLDRLGSIFSSNHLSSEFGGDSEMGNAGENQIIGNEIDGESKSRLLSHFYDDRINNQSPAGTTKGTSDENSSTPRSSANIRLQTLSPNNPTEVRLKYLSSGVVKI